MKQIVIKFDQTGAVKIDAVGYKGQGCKEATSAFEKAFANAKKVAAHDKPEINAMGGVGEQQKTRRF